MSDPFAIPLLSDAGSTATGLEPSETLEPSVSLATHPTRTLVPDELVAKMTSRELSRWKSIAAFLIVFAPFSSSISSRSSLTSPLTGCMVTAVNGTAVDNYSVPKWWCVLCNHDTSTVSIGHAFAGTIIGTMIALIVFNMMRRFTVACKRALRILAFGIRVSNKSNQIEQMTSLVILAIVLFLYSVLSLIIQSDSNTSLSNCVLPSSPSHPTTPSTTYNLDMQCSLTEDSRVWWHTLANSVTLMAAFAPILTYLFFRARDLYYNVTIRDLLKLSGAKERVAKLVLYSIDCQVLEKILSEASNEWAFQHYGRPSWCTRTSETGNWDYFVFMENNPEVTRQMLEFVMPRILAQAVLIPPADRMKDLDANVKYSWWFC